MLVVSFTMQGSFAVLINTRKCVALFVHYVEYL